MTSTRVDLMHRESRRRTTWRRSITAGFVATILTVAPLGRPVAAAGNFLWNASRGTSVIYLAGWLHMLSKEHYPLSAPFEEAFKDSDLIVEEVDLGEMEAPDAQMQLIGRGMFSNGQTL